MFKIRAESVEGENAGEVTVPRKEVRGIPPTIMAVVRYKVAVGGEKFARRCCVIDQRKIPSGMGHIQPAGSPARKGPIDDATELASLPQ